MGQSLTYQYNVLNRVTQITDALAGPTAFTYDPNSNLLTVTDAKNQTTAYTYNNMDRVATRQDPLTKTESYGYDSNGNVTTVTDRKSQATTFTYDKLDRRKTVTYQDGSTVTYTYDAGDRITQIVDSVAGTITRTYDGLDRLTQEVSPQGTVSYTYDAAGRRTSMMVAGQPAVTYTYDNANRLTQTTQGSSNVTISYDDAGRRTSLTLPTGNNITYAYDAASQLTSLTYKQGTTTLGTLTHTYDKAGNRTIQGGTWAAIGLPQPSGTMSYNANNQLLTFSGYTLTYDFNGNLTSAADSSGTAMYTWNARNQPTGIAAPGLTASFAYDAFGRRVTKTINSAATSFLYDGLNPVQELAGTTPTANMLTGLGIDEVFTRTDSAGTRGFLDDALGSPRALADNTGVVQTSYTYEPFGNTSVSGATSTNSFQYTGRENDGTGLYYYRARYYSPRLQRFMSEDPLRSADGSINLYGYVQNNPVRFTDPYGLFTVVGGAGFSVVGPRGGFEGSAGLYLETSDGSAGYFTATGVGIGLNASADVFGGAIFGELQGITANANFIAGPLSATFMFDAVTGDFVGFTVGLGPSTPQVPPVGGSGTISATGAACLFNCPPPTPASGTGKSSK